MKCDFVQIPYKDKTTGTTKMVGGFVCGGRGGKVKGPPPCEFCLEEYIPSGRWQDVRDGVRQCDHPIGGVDERGLKKTCDKFICKQHAVRQGEFDWCPEHREAHRYVPLEASR